MATKIHKQVHEGVGFEVEKIFGMWTIYYDNDQIDESIFNWENTIYMPSSSMVIQLIFMR
jgi:hypothetical protein